jgi:MscS family membrane protein
MLDLTIGQVFGLLLAAVATYFVGRLLGRWAHRTVYRRILIARTAADERLVLRLAGPLEGLGMVAVWQLALSSFVLPADALGFCRAIGHIAFIVMLAWGAIRMVDTGVESFANRSPWLTDQRAAKSLVPLAKRITKVVLGTVAGVMILARLGYSVGPLLVVLAIVGAALALAAHRPLENVLAAYAILGDHGIREGDTVRLDSGVVGVIEAIGLYSTRLRKEDHTHVIVPNRKLADAQIERAFQRAPTRAHAAVPPPEGARVTRTSSPGEVS